MTDPDQHVKDLERRLRMMKNQAGQLPAPSWFRHELVEAAKSFDELAAELKQLRDVSAAHVDLWAQEWERAERAEAALRKLYDYTVALEGASGAWFATRSYAKLPEGGREAGELARAALAGRDTDAGEATGDIDIDCNLFPRDVDAGEKTSWPAWARLREWTHEAKHGWSYDSEELNEHAADLRLALDAIEAAQAVAILTYDPFRTDAQNDELQYRAKRWDDAITALTKVSNV
jgi:hypothetical protein